jgi:hypothetical protein
MLPSRVRLRGYPGHDEAMAIAESAAGMVGVTALRALANEAFGSRRRCTY